MKRFVYSSNTLDEFEEGFFIEVGRKAIFLRSSNKNLTAPIVTRLIEQLCIFRNFSEEKTQMLINDEEVRKEVRYETSKVSIEHLIGSSNSFYSIKGKYFTINMPDDEFYETVNVI